LKVPRAHKRDAALFQVWFVGKELRPLCPVYQRRKSWRRALVDRESWVIPPGRRVETKQMLRLSQGHLRGPTVTTLLRHFSVQMQRLSHSRILQEMPKPTDLIRRLEKRVSKRISSEDNGAWPAAAFALCRSTDVRVGEGTGVAPIMLSVSPISSTGGVGGERERRTTAKASNLRFQTTTAELAQPGRRRRPLTSGLGQTVSRRGEPVKRITSKLFAKPLSRLDLSGRSPGCNQRAQRLRRSPRYKNL
jgi:hypothetical protein